MLVKKYKCTRRLPGPYSVETAPCYNEFWGPEGLEICPNCGKKGTLEMDERDWQVELDEREFSKPQ
jgi:hypothetical protein